MNVIEFKEDIELNTNIVYCIVDRTDQAIEQTRIKNISDWTIQNITVLGYTVLVSSSEDSMLRAADEFDYAVVLSTGTELIEGYSFHEHVEDFCNTQDFFIAGHILDRDDSYYELHHQSYIINLKHYRDLGQPNIGKEHFYSTHTQIEPNRSVDNIHDNYTPLFVLPGSQPKTYTHKRHGWNIISICLANNLPLIVVDNDFRRFKIHYYPEYIEPFYDSIQFNHKRESFCSGMAVYLNNSESVPKENLHKNISQLIVPAAGSLWIRYLLTHGFDQNTVVKFYDYSLPTLEFIKELLLWDGNDYPKFAMKYFENKFSFLENSYILPFCGDSDLKNAMPEISIEVWQKIKNLKFEFYWVNLLESDDLNWISDLPNTIVVCSNIFNYIGTASNYSVRARVQAENNFIEKLKNVCPNSYIYFSRRAANCFKSYTNNNKLVPVSMIYTTKIDELKKPSWHMNNDWE
jgi:hypothetical protein